MEEGRRRRSQAERTAATREALLGAAVDLLVEQGYSGVTTTRVAHRAGVSVGALQHHFGTKADLLSAAVEHVFARRQAEFAKAMADLPADEDRMDAAVDALWSIFSGPTFVAWLELWVAARTDAGLAEVLIPVQEEFTRRSTELFAEVVGDVAGAEDPHVRDLALSLTYNALDGLALGRLLGDRIQFPTSTDEGVFTLKFIGHALFPR